MSGFGAPAAGSIVDGPSSSTNNAIAKFNGTTGKLIQNSGVTIDSSNNVTIPGVTHIQSSIVADVSSIGVIFPTNQSAGFSINDNVVHFIRFVSTTGAKFMDILGTQTNNNATAGYIGELAGPITRLRSNATAMTSPNTLNVCTTASLTLTAGDWDIRGFVGFLGAAGTSVTLLKAAISKTSATLPASDTTAVPTAGEVIVEQDTAANAIGANTIVLPIPSYRVSLAASTDFWLVAAATFSVAALTAYGSMEARRVR